MPERTSNPNFAAKVVTLTPEMAASLLAKNPRNRHISRTNYNLVRRAIENGEWALNGESIKVSENGYILDGQHRCQAVVDTGISIRTLFIEGLADEVQDTMDTGKSRSLKDVLTIRGETNAISLSALIRKFVMAERYGFAAAFYNPNAQRPITIPESLAWLDNNGWVRDYVMPGKSISAKTGIGSASAGFLMRTFDEIDAEDSAHFWARLCDGANLPIDSPVLALSRSLKIIRDNVRGERSQKYIGALVIKAWNKYRLGEPVSQLKFRIGGANPETFPEPR